jgi:hypothetical protein
MRERLKNLLVCSAIGCVAVMLWGIGLQSAEAKTPIVYFTDLFHPAIDPDDHFDLATLFALKEFDIKAIILDNHGDKPDKNQGNACGRPALEQMMHITGRKVPWAIGLKGKLRSRDDKALDMDEKWQGGVRCLLSVLRNSPEKVVVKLSSGCDFAAALNREPELVRAKVKAVYLHAGNGPSGRQWEYNVRLDPIAYQRVFESGVPVYWCPCFGTAGYQTYFIVPDQSALFNACTPPVQRYFAYAFAQSKADPLAFLDAGSYTLPGGRRNMWSTPTLAHAAGRRIYRRGDEYVLLTPADAARAGLAGEEVQAFAFVPVRAVPDRTQGREPGSLQVELKAAQPNAFVFRQTNPQYQQIFISCLKNLLAELGR